MTPHGNAENGLNLANGCISYDQLFRVLNEAVALYTHIYGYGTVKCKFLSNLLCRTIINLTEFGCPLPANLDLNFTVCSSVSNSSMFAAQPGTRILFRNGPYITSKLSKWSGVQSTNHDIPPFCFRCLKAVIARSTMSTSRCLP
jgi:hypothetical protein